MSKVINALTSDYQADLNAAAAVGKKYSQAKNEFNAAVESGNQARIAKAQVALNQAQEISVSLAKTNEQEHDLIMQLLQSLA